MKSNYKIWLSPPSIGSDVLERVHQELSADIAKPANSLRAFERNICRVTGGNHAVGLNSCSSALHLAMILEGIGREDIVLTSTFTYVAAANAIGYTGAKAVFVDSELETWNMCPELLKKAIESYIKKGKKPAAVLVVHTYGMPAKMSEIIEICDRYEIPIIEDAAASLGSTYKGQMTGTLGKYGTYSFNYNKIITTCGGGVLFVPDEEMVQRAKYMSTHARSNQPHYEHEVAGFNYIMGGMAAALGNAQIDELPTKVEEKRALYKRYYDGLGHIPKLSFLDEPEGIICNRWLSNIVMHDAESCKELKACLANRGVETRNFWKPMHHQPLFDGYDFFENGNAGELFKRGLSLPSGLGLEKEHQQSIIRIIKEFFS